MVSLIICFATDVFDKVAVRKGSFSIASSWLMQNIVFWLYDAKYCVFFCEIDMVDIRVQTIRFFCEIDYVEIFTVKTNRYQHIGENY